MTATEWEWLVGVELEGQPPKGGFMGSYCGVPVYCDIDDHEHDLETELREVLQESIARNRRASNVS